MNIFSITAANRFFSAASALLFLMMLVSASHASEGRQLWQSRDQFVALERQGLHQNETRLLNDHPVEISSDRLTAILASIEIQSADSGKPEQIITNQSLELLVPQLLLGFRQAAPNEDITFAVIGLHKSALGLGKSPKVSTGRLFYQGGRFNIIFGLVRKDFDERADRRLSPFTPGSRQKVAEGEWTLLPHTGQSGYKQVRRDWVTFSDEWQTPVVQTPVAVENSPSTKSAPAQNKDTRTPAERLTTLKELQEKGLISDEEYQSKRLEILNEL